MTVYLITTSHTYYKDYRVEADTEDEARNLVLSGCADHCDEDWGNDIQIEEVEEEEEKTSDTVYGRPFIPTFDDQL